MIEAVHRDNVIALVCNLIHPMKELDRFKFLFSNFQTLRIFDIHASYLLQRWYVSDLTMCVYLNETIRILYFHVYISFNVFIE